MAIDSVSQKPREVARPEPRPKEELQSKPKEVKEEQPAPEVRRSEEDGKKEIAQA